MATLTGFLSDNEGTYIEKDPVANLSYTLDWSQWLPSGQTINSSDWTVESITGDASPLTEGANTNTNTTTTVVLSSGTSGKIYKIYNTITTSTGLVDRRYFRIKVRSRTL